MSARLEVDLEALDANLRVLRDRVAPADLMLVVKDDAYGHGIARVVPRAMSAGVRWIGAFDAPTARDVRVVAPDADIFVWMLADRDDVVEAAALGAHLGVGDPDLLEEVAAVAAETAAPISIHLKIDTGLHRNGFRPEDWSGAVARAVALQAGGHVRIGGIWSHIGEASDEDDDDARAVFDTAVAEARAHGLDGVVRHLAASSASSVRPEFRYDLVRVGAFAYGIAPAGGPDADALGIRPISRLVASVTDVSDHEVRLDVGSLDGLPSPLAGRVDVRTPVGLRRVRSIAHHESAIDRWDDARIGDEVTVYGGGAIAGTSWAEAIDTIGEEIATRLSPRVARRYIG
jgi:alanine racemase